MKLRIIIIAGLCILLAILSILCINGTQTKDPLIAEELAAYHNRKEYTSLSTPAEKVAYSLGSIHFSLDFDNRSEQYLATFYNIVSKLENQYYYRVLLNIPFAPLNLNLWIPNTAVPLDVESFMAGYSQPTEKKILTPYLAGE